MTVIALPPRLCFQTANWDLDRNVAVSTSPLSRTTQRVVRSGDQWTCTLVAPPLRAEDAGLMAAFLSEASAGDAWFYASPPQNQLLGGLETFEYLPDDDFVLGTYPWTTETNIALNTNARMLRVLSMLNGNSGGTRRLFNVDTDDLNLPFVAMADLPIGANANTVNWQLKKQSGDTLIAGGTFASGDRAVLLATPDVSPVYLRLGLSNEAQYAFAFLQNPSFARCLTVNGGSQTGRTLNVSGGPTATNGILKAGQFVTVKVGTKWQLLRLKRDVDTLPGSGNAKLFFEPALRDSPSNGTPVIVHKPFVRMMIPRQAMSEAVGQARFSGFQIDAVEDPTP